MASVNMPAAVILHHSATRDGQVNDWEAIRRYHIDHNGWTDIGYHFGVERENGKVVVRYGRDPCVQGAHAKGANRNSLGVCMVGDYTEHWPDPTFYEMVVRLIKSLMMVYDMRPQQVMGHREVAPHGYTECPGLAVDMRDLRKILGKDPLLGGPEFPRAA